MYKYRGLKAKAGGLGGPGAEPTRQDGQREDVATGSSSRQLPSVQSGGQLQPRVPLGPVRALPGLHPPHLTRSLPALHKRARASRVGVHRPRHHLHADQLSAVLRPVVSLVGTLNLLRSGSRLASLFANCSPQDSFWCWIRLVWGSMGHARRTVAQQSVRC